MKLIFFKEFDLVALAHAIDEYQLAPGDIGTIVHIYDDKEAFEVEFVTAEGQTVALLTLTRADIRPFQGNEVFHARELISSEHTQ